MAADCHEVWQSQPAGTLKACTGIGSPLHRQSAVCRATQFVTSLDNAVSHRGYSLASCIVDAEWLIGLGSDIG